MGESNAQIEPEVIGGGGEIREGKDSFIAFTNASSGGLKICSLLTDLHSYVYVF